MGYYVRLLNSTAMIPADKVDEAYRVMCALNDRDEFKSGGSYGGEFDSRKPRPAGMNHHPARWYAWMDANYPETCGSAKDVLEALGFVVGVAEDGSLSIQDYDSKTGAEGLFIDAIAHLVPPGAFMEWQGEEGAMWRWRFDGDRLIQQEPVPAKVVWRDLDLGITAEMERSLSRSQSA